MKLIDLSQTLSADTPVYPGDPTPEVTRRNDAAKDGFTDHRLHTGMHVGTHVDAPEHMLPGGKKLSEMPLESFSGPGCLLDVRGKRPIDAPALRGAELKRGDVLLLWTGLAEDFGSQAYFKDYPEVTAGFAEACVSLGVRMVGLDSPSPDRPPFAAHKILLGAGIPILENLTGLEQLVQKKFTIDAFPPKLALEAAPVRVVARVD